MKDNETKVLKLKDNETKVLQLRDIETEVDSKRNNNNAVSKSVIEDTVHMSISSIGQTCAPILA